MNQRQLFLLSPYRPPTSYPVSLSAAEAAAWLNAWAALWHPFALIGAAYPPTAASAYDHSEPVAYAIYALPDGPSLHLTDDWKATAAARQACVIEASDNREQSFAALATALGDRPSVPASIVRSFTGLGFGYLMLETMFDAANHDRLLDVAAFWSDVQAAAAVALSEQPQAAMPHLTAAGSKLQAAREGLSPDGVRLIDILSRTDATTADPWPCTLRPSRPVALVASTRVLRGMASEHPAIFDQLKTAVAEGSVVLCVGVHDDRDDTLLPIESQLWSIRQARQDCQELFGVAPRVFGRMRSEQHPQLPSWLSAAGFHGMLALNLDGATLPVRYSSLIQWPGPDGKAINAFTRDPLPVHEPATFFNLAHHLHDSTGRESSPMFALLHTQPAAAAYDDLLALSELANVFGEWQSLERLLEDSHDAEYVAVASADDFMIDTLDDRVTRRSSPEPVSGFAKHLRQRRIIDSAYTLAALQRSLSAPTQDDHRLLQRIAASEAAMESSADAESPVDLESECAQRLAERLLARSESQQPGWLILNSSGSARRVGLELSAPAPIPVDGPVKSSEFIDGTARVVVEVPGLGYAWIPRGMPGTVLPKPRLRLAEGTTVRNEFIEAEVDPATGAAKAIRDRKHGITRFGQALVWHPGSRMTARSVRVTHAGAVLGEILSEGDILDDEDQFVASFRQRLRAWAGRPALELSIEIQAKLPSTYYPWHSFLGCRFAWRDERAALFRGVNGMNARTDLHRPSSPDYLEIRLGRERSYLFTGGLPFLQKQGGRMVDVILVPPGERESHFELLIAFDREWPMATAYSWMHKLPVLPVDRGPPPAGPTGWLAQCDLPSLLLTSLKPTGPGRAVEARFVETAGYAASADLRFARDPSRAAIVDLNGDEIMTVQRIGDAVPLDCSAHELFTVRLDWD